MTTLVGLLATVGCSLIDLDAFAAPPADTPPGEDVEGDAGGPDGSDPNSALGCDDGRRDLCADFDVGAVGDEWTRIHGDVSLDSSSSTSPPNSAKMSVAGDDLSGLTKFFAVESPSAIACEFSFQPRFSKPNAPVQFFGMVTWDGPEVNMFEVGLRIASTGQQTFFWEGAGPTGTKTSKRELAVTLPEDTWTRVHMRFDIKAGEAEVRFDSGETHHFAVPSLAQSEVRLLGVFVGLDSRSPSEPSRVVAFDDVVCDLTR